MSIGKKVNDIKENKYLCMVVLGTILLFAFIVILLNSIISKGHNVLYSSRGQNINILNQVGYEIKDGVYHVIDENMHYLTFPYSKECDEFLIVFDEYPSQESEVTIWSMDSAGNVLSESEVYWRESDRWIFVNEIPENTELIALAIDEDFKIHGVINSVYYQNNKIKYLAVGISFVLILLLAILVYKRKIFQNGLLSCYDEIFAGREVWKSRLRRITICISVVCGVLIISSGLLYFISSHNISILGVNFAFNWKTVFVFSVGIIAIILFVMNIIRRNDTNAVKKYALFIILIIGTAYSFVEPAVNGISWDDEIHYKNASTLSHILDRKKSFTDQEIYEQYQSVILEKNLYSFESEEKFRKLNNYLDKENYFYELTTEKVNLKSISYLPMSIGLCMARGLNLPNYMILIMGRWFNFLFLFIICCISMKVLDYGNVIIAFFALVPTNIFMAASYSYDTWLIALVFIGYACIFNERQHIDKSISKTMMICIPLILILANVSKPVYFVLIIPAFFIQAEKFESKKQKILYRIWVILATILPFILIMINNIFGAGVGDIRGGSDVNSAKQIEFIKNNMGDFIKILFEFLKGYLNPLIHGDYAFNSLAYNGFMKYGRVILAILIIGALINHQTEKRAFPVWYRICVLLLYVGVGALCGAAMYVSFTAVAADYVSGCQYRYLFPVLFPTLYVLTRIKISKEIFKKEIIEKKRIEKSVITILNSLLILLMAEINLYCIWQGCVQYY